MENKNLSPQGALPIKVSDDIILNLLTLKDAPELLKLVNRNRKYLREWLDWLDDNTQIEDAEYFINLSLDQFQKKESLNLGIFRENDILGAVTINEFKWDTREIVIGYWLSEVETGKGLMTKCCKALINFAFQNYDIQCVEIKCAPENYKSRMIPERLGFKITEVLKDYQWLYDHYVDNIVYKVSKQEWQKIST